VSPISEEAGKVAATTVEALRQTPMTLALVIFNVLFMLVVAYMSAKNSADTSEEMKRMHALVEKVLSTCDDKGGRNAN
jgi:hypothetical protein